MKKRIPRILLLVDKRDWAFDICAREYSRYLSDEFSFTIKYVEEKPVLLPSLFDLIHVFWWGEKYYQHFFWPKRKILKEVSSHRWEDDIRYGPCTPKEMERKYLYDATTVFCTSKILYSKIAPFFSNTCLVDNGYSPAKFKYVKPRTGKSLTLCWVGNDKDAVKGINDILLPAAGNEYIINIATNINHDNLCSFYNEYDLFLIGSKHEASPLTLIEAMACGCFPVCTNVGIVPDLIQHKQNGYIVENRTIDDFKRAFSWCKDNIQFVRDAGRLNSQIIYEKRRWEICSESFRKAYRKALMSAMVK